MERGLNVECAEDHNILENTSQFSCNYLELKTNLDKKIPSVSVNSSKTASCFRVSFFYCQNISPPEFKNEPVTSPDERY